LEPTWLGLEGCLPYFRLLEADWDFHDELHGKDGPVAIRRHGEVDWPPFCRAIGAAPSDGTWLWRSPKIASSQRLGDDPYRAEPVQAQT
jgi:hypothetical protein